MRYGPGGVMDALVEAEIRGRVNRVLGGHSKTSVKLYIFEEGHALWTRGSDGRVTCPLNSAPGKAIKSQLPYFEHTEDELVIHYPLLSPKTAQTSCSSVVRISVCVDNGLFAIDDSFSRVLTLLAISIDRSLDMRALHSSAKKKRRAFSTCSV